VAADGNILRPIELIPDPAPASLIRHQGCPVLIFHDPRTIAVPAPVPLDLGAAPGIDEGCTGTLQLEHQKRKRTMETGQPRFTDPDHVQETLCTGPCWTSGYTNQTMQIVLTVTRHDVAMINEGRFTQPPDYVVVARIVMTTKGALELAEAIKSTVAKHQAVTGRLHSSSGHA
jgi:hypothetical protein